MHATLLATHGAQGVLLVVSILRSGQRNDLREERHCCEYFSFRQVGRTNPSSEAGASRLASPFMPSFLCRLVGSAPKGGALSHPIPAVTFPASQKWSGASPSPYGAGARLADARCPCYSVCRDPTLPSFSLVPRRHISYHLFYFFLFNTRVTGS